MLEWRFDRATGLDDVTSLQDCWQYYKKLTKEQRAVLESASEFEALRCATPTPAAHGVYMGSPLYQTPMLRAFPETFAYPMPHH